jgi:hypothetical protein
MIKYENEWNMEVYTYNEEEPQPYGGFGHNTYIIGDYGNNDNINHHDNANEGKFEGYGVFREGETEPEGIFNYNIFTAQTVPLQEGVVYSAFSNPPIINTPYIDNNILNFYFLHDLQFWIENVGGTYLVYVDYDNEIKEDVTFTNKIKIPNNTNFTVKDGINVTVAKSLTPNKVKALGDEPIVPSELNFGVNTSLKIPNNSKLIAEDNSKIVVNNNVSINLQGELELRDESEMTIKGIVDFSNGEIILQENAKIYLTESSYLKNVKISGAGSVYIKCSRPIFEDCIINCNIAEYSTTQGSRIKCKGDIELNTNISIPGNYDIYLYEDANLTVNGELMLNEGSKIVGDLTSNTFDINGKFDFIATTEIVDLPQVNGSGGFYVNSTQNLSINNLRATNSYINLNANLNDVVIDSSVFNNATLSVNSFSNLTQGLCKVENSHFYNLSDKEALKVDNFNMFSIKNNTIENNEGHGIVVYNSGQLDLPYRKIENCTIRNNQKNDTAKGIIIYNSVADIHNNQIYNNDFGIALFHNSVVSIYGDKPGKIQAITQSIYDNTYYQIYTDDTSFPWKFEYNRIAEDNSQVARVFYDRHKPQPVTLIATNNCWDMNFVPTEDLYPFNLYVYDPVWNCGLAPLELSGIEDPSKALFEEAITDIENDEYQLAEAKLKTIVSDYPNSDYTVSALKTMPVVSTTGKGTYDELIQYFQTNATIQNSESLKKLTGYIISELNINEGAYNEALEFYESIISNPPTEADYVYALIDAARVNSLVQAGGGKAPANFKYQDLMPKTQEASNIRNRQYIDGLVKIHKNATVEIENETNDVNTKEDIFNVYPNPVSSTANIIYSTGKTGTVEIEIFDIAGKKVYEHQTQANQGVNKHVISVKDLKNGIYFVKVSINSKTETKRIVINQ